MLIFALELIERLNGYDLDCTRGHYGGIKYGGLKQLEGIGPNGETILDFSIYDA